jgi:hypothetical protein
MTDNGHPLRDAPSPCGSSRSVSPLRASVADAWEPNDLLPEQCRRCLHENAVWFAPSPLWNAVMRGGSIDGQPIYEDMVCAACFISLAQEKGIADRFRVTAEAVHIPLETVTPSGRIWDEQTWLWHPSPTGRGEDFKIPKGLGSIPRGATKSAKAIEAGTVETERLDAKHESAAPSGVCPDTPKESI